MEGLIVLSADLEGLGLNIGALFRGWIWRVTYLFTVLMRFEQVLGMNESLGKAEFSQE